MIKNEFTRDVRTQERRFIERKSNYGRQTVLIQWIFSLDLESEEI